MSPRLDEKISFFFAPPLPMQTGHSASTLHLARREVQDCLLGDVLPEEVALKDPRRHRLFATCMVIVAGVDLLSKFHSGSDAIGGVNQRFKSFASEFMFGNVKSADELSEVLYLGCRNPLLHSFSLHNAKFKITLVQGLPPAAVIGRVNSSSDTYVINVEGLFTGFVQAIRAYEAKLRSDTDLQAKFSVMFPAYGSLGMQSVALKPL